MHPKSVLLSGCILHFDYLISVYREYFKLDVAQGEAAAGVYPAELLIRKTAAVCILGDIDITRNEP